MCITEESWNINMSVEFNSLFINVLDSCLVEWFNMRPDSCSLVINITLLLMKDTVFVVV